MRRSGVRFPEAALFYTFRHRPWWDAVFAACYGCRTLYPLSCLCGDRVLASPAGYRVGPVFIVLPVTLLGAVVLFDLSALLSGIDLVEQVARWILGTGLVVGLLVLTAVLIEQTATMSATAEHRIRGAVSS